MLVSNYESGDFRILEDLLRQPMTDDEFHDLGFSVEYILKRNSTSDAEASLLLLYEKTPCSNCRESFVRFLINMDKIPDWMRSECRYDANAGTTKQFCEPAYVLNPVFRSIDPKHPTPTNR